MVIFLKQIMERTIKVARIVLCGSEKHQKYKTTKNMPQPIGLKMAEIKSLNEGINNQKYFLQISIKKQIQGNKIFVFESSKKINSLLND